ncbi:MAG: hypothetical protein V1672_01480 [Candidatus Diapherotrites archaeon]
MIRRFLNNLFTRGKQPRKPRPDKKPDKERDDPKLNEFIKQHSSIETYGQRQITPQEISGLCEQGSEFIIKNHVQLCELISEKIEILDDSRVADAFSFFRDLNEGRQPQSNANVTEKTRLIEAWTNAQNNIIRLTKKKH